MRHYSNAINMLLRGRLDGAVTDYRENTLECAGELMYDDRWEGKHICMAKVWTDSNKQEPVCGGEAIVAYQERCVCLFSTTLFRLFVLIVLIDAAILSTRMPSPLLAVALEYIAVKTERRLTCSPPTFSIPFGAWPIWRQSLPTRQQRLSPVYITGKPSPTVSRILSSFPRTKERTNDGTDSFFFAPSPALRLSSSLSPSQVSALTFGTVTTT